MVISTVCSRGIYVFLTQRYRILCFDCGIGFIGRFFGGFRSDFFHGSGCHFGRMLLHDLTALCVFLFSCTKYERIYNCYAPRQKACYRRDGLFVFVMQK